MDEYQLDDIADSLREIRSNTGVLEWGFIIVIILLATGSNFSSNQITDYSRSCNQENVSAQDCQSWTLDRTIYYVNSNAQAVSWVDQNAPAAPMALAGCVVANARNWYCAPFGFSQGNVMDNDPIDKLFTTQHFGFFTYWWYRFLNLF